MLLLTCPDQRGIVADVAAWVASVGGNIVDAGQCSDAEHGLFLQRVEFDHDASHDDLRGEFEPVAARWSMQWQLHDPSGAPGSSGRSGRARLVVLTSREPHCLYDLLGRCATDDLPAEVAAVISNHADHRLVADRFDTRFLHEPVAGDPSRPTAEAKAAQELAVVGHLRSLQPDLIVLARYMRVLSPAFCEEFGPATINIHHSFLPAFSGARAYHQAWERGVKLIGATAHYVTSELDAGPIIAQDVARVSHADTPRTLARRGRDLEALVLATAVRAHLEHRVVAYANRTVVFE